MFPGGLNIEWKLPLLAPVLSGAKNYHSNFDDVMPILWEPCHIQTKNGVHTLGKWHLLMQIYGWVLWYIIYRTAIRPSVGWYPQFFRVWPVLPLGFRTVLSVLPHFFVEATFTMPEDWRWNLRDHFFMEGVKVKSHFFCFIRTDLKMTHFLWSRSTKKNPKFAPAAQIISLKK